MACFPRAVKTALELIVKQADRLDGIVERVCS
jgi:hypothetical protein